MRDFFFAFSQKVAFFLEKRTVPGKFVLNIHFSEMVYNRTNFVYFAYRQSTSKLFSGFHKFQLMNLTNETIYYGYPVTFEQLDIERNDRFELFKNPKSLFYKTIKVNDAADYLQEMKKNFEEEFNLTTRNIILLNEETDDFKREIDDELFEQFYLQVQNVSDHNSPVSLNYEQKISKIYVTQDFYPNHDYPNFKIAFSFLTRQTEIQNDDNNAKLVLSLLNTLSLWLNLYILDIYVYLIFILRPIEKIYEFLIRSELYLKTISI